MSPEARDYIERRIVELGALVGLLAYLAPEDFVICRPHAGQAALLADRLVEEVLQKLKEAAREPQA